MQHCRRNMKIHPLTTKSWEVVPEIFSAISSEFLYEEVQYVWCNVKSCWLFLYTAVVIWNNLLHVENCFISTAVLLLRYMSFKLSNFWKLIIYKIPIKKSGDTSKYFMQLLVSIKNKQMDIIFKWAFLIRHWINDWSLCLHSSQSNAAELSSDTRGPVSTNVSIYAASDHLLSHSTAAKVFRKSRNKLSNALLELSII